jgi:hypothetical protein
MDPASKQEVHRIFPKIVLKGGTGERVVSDDERQMFAPLK